jgi:hypothetical protein
LDRTVDPVVAGSSPVALAGDIRCPNEDKP